jgi:hypothetical protein
MVRVGLERGACVRPATNRDARQAIDAGKFDFE